MSRYLFLVLLLSHGFRSLASGFEAEKMSVMGLIAGHAITNRHVLIDIILEFPKKVSSRGFEWITDAEMSRGFERCVTQQMIVEDLKILGDASVTQNKLNTRYSKFRKDLGQVRYRSILKDLEVTEKVLRERLSQKIQVERAIEEKVALALNTRLEKLSDEEKAKISGKAIEDWLSQLKARYRVQIFRKDE